MFKLHRGRARIDYYPKKASTVIDVGDALMFDDDGKVTTHDGGKKKIIGIAMKNVRSTDSDYASNTKIPVQIGASEDAEFVFETTGLATTDVGQSIGVSTSDPGLASVSGMPTMVVKEYNSSTLGSAAFIDPIDGFGDSESQNNNVVTVTIGGNGDYNVESTATDANVQINAAITAMNAAGGGLVKLMPGTYNCSSFINMKSNVVLEGCGESSYIVFANGKHMNNLGQSNFKVLNLKISNIDNTEGLSGSTSSITVAYNIVNINCQNFEIAYNHLEAYAFGIFMTSSTTQLPLQPCKDAFIHHNYIHGACGNDLIGGGQGTDSAPGTYNIKVSDNILVQEDGLTGGAEYYTAFDMTGATKLNITNNTMYGSLLLGSERDPDETTIISGNIVLPVLSSTDVACSIEIEDDTNTGDISGKCLIVNNYLQGGWIRLIGRSSQHIKYVSVLNNMVVNDIALTNGGHLNIEQTGVRLKYADNCLVSNNHLTCNTGNSNEETGLRVEDSLNNVFSNNWIDGYYLGIYQSGTSTGNTYHDNRITNCTSFITSTTLSGAICYNNYGSDTPGLYAQGNVTGATTFTCTNGNTITATLTGNITVTLPTTYAAYGSVLTLILTQDGTGGHTVTWPANFKKAGGALALSAGAAAVDVIKMVFDGTNYREVSRALNQS